MPQDEIFISGDMSARLVNPKAPVAIAKENRADKQNILIKSLPINKLHHVTPALILMGPHQKNNLNIYAVKKTAHDLS